MHQPATSDRATLEARQRASLGALIEAIVPANGFYTPLLAEAGLGPGCSLEDFCTKMPLTNKPELMTDQEANPPYGSVHTYEPQRYVRCHQTSGTTGKPLRWLDTVESWQWMVDCWKEVFYAAGVGADDRVMFTFSFGPFIGFWLAWDAAQQIGCLCIPGGGMNSAQRIRLMTDNSATVLCCTPTYGTRLAEVAQAEGIDLRETSVKKIIAAGEPGSSVPAVRERLSSLWNGAEIFDHHGMTEIGCVTYQCPKRPGVLHVLEEAFIAEVIEPQTLEPVAPGEKGELILTNLGRHGSPLLRYRTGDLVQPEAPGESGLCACGTPNLALVGGILDRADDMVVVRGVNVYPSGVNLVLRAHAGVGEYRVEIDRSSAMTEMRILVEPAGDSTEPPEQLAASIGHDLREALALRVPIEVVEPGSLPRFEMKARRWVVQ